MSGSHCGWRKYGMLPRAEGAGDSSTDPHDNTAAAARRKGRATTARTRHLGMDGVVTIVTLLPIQRVQCFVAKPGLEVRRTLLRFLRYPQCMVPEDNATVGAYAVMVASSIVQDWD